MQSLQDMIPDSNRFDELPAMAEVKQTIMNYPAVQEFLQEHQEEITHEMIEQSYSKLHEFMKEHQLLEQGVERTKPGFYPELFVYNHHYIDVRYIPTKNFLNRQTERNRQLRIHNDTMSAQVRHAEIRDFDIDSAQRQRLLGEVMSFIEKYQENRHRPPKGMYLSGSFGVGKSFLMGAMVNYLSREDNATIGMTHVPTFANDLKETFLTNTTQQTINRVKEMDVLILDDIGAESLTPWLRDDVLSVILEYRMKENLPTFFTSNFTMNDLQQHLAVTKTSTDTMKAARIMERIRYLADEFILEGKNRRHR